VILSSEKIGVAVNIYFHSFILNDMIVVDRFTIKNGVQIWMDYLWVTMFLLALILLLITII
jgi:hypothetical protein